MYPAREGDQSEVKFTLVGLEKLVLFELFSKSRLWMQTICDYLQRAFIHRLDNKRQPYSRDTSWWLEIMRIRVCIRIRCPNTVCPFCLLFSTFTVLQTKEPGIISSHPQIKSPPTVKSTLDQINLLSFLDVFVLGIAGSESSTKTPQVSAVEMACTQQMSCKSLLTVKQVVNSARQFSSPLQLPRHVLVTQIFPINFFSSYCCPSPIYLAPFSLWTEVQEQDSNY